METPSVFDFTSPREFLLETLKSKQAVNPKFSLRAWVQHMDLASHSLLSMVLNGKRRLTPQLAVKIRRALSLSNEEEKYFDALVLYANASTEEEKELFAGILEGLHPQKQFAELKTEVIRSLTDWKHIAVLEMTRLNDFREDIEWMAKRLGHGTKPEEINLILNRLEKVGLLGRNKKGQLKTQIDQEISANDIPNKKVRQLQQEFLNVAKDALEYQSVQEREFFQYTFVMNKCDLEKAKKTLRQFREQFIFDFESETGDHVYHFGHQIFKITKDTNKDSGVLK